MKKFKVVALVLVWAAVMLALLAYIVVGKGRESMMLSFGMNFNQVVLKEERHFAEGITSLNVNTRYEAIEMLATDAPDFRVTQYGGQNRTDEAFTSERQGATLKLSTQRADSVFVGISFAIDKLVIEIPRTWHGTVALEASSGSLAVSDQFTFENLVMNTSSGSIRCTERITVKNADFKTSSGSIRIRDTIACEESLRLESNSGSVSTAEGRARALTIGTSSGSIRLEDMRADSFDIKASSGSIHAEGLAGGGNIKAKSGSVRIDMLDALGDVDVNTSSGSIAFTLPQMLSFEFLGKSSSGTIRTDFSAKGGGRNNNVRETVGSSPLITIKAESGSGGIRIDRE